jgi:hypothetical protein
MYYYNHNLNYYPELTKNLQINNNIIEINSNINQKFIANATIIYNFYEIYNKFLNHNESISFNDFIEYDKDKYKLIDTSEYRIKDKLKKCYNLLFDIVKEGISKEIIVKYLSKFNLTYIKIYKLKEEFIIKLRHFILNILEQIKSKNIFC